MWQSARTGVTTTLRFAFAGIKILSRGLQVEQPVDVVSLQHTRPAPFFTPHISPKGTHRLWNEIFSVFSPARAIYCFLSIGIDMPARKDVCYLLNVVGFAGSVAGIATNREIAKTSFLSLINAFAPWGMVNKYRIGETWGTGCPTGSMRRTACGGGDFSSRARTRTPGTSTASRQLPEPKRGRGASCGCRAPVRWLWSVPRRCVRS